MTRIVVPEILDSLDSDDPRAVRSRRDLKFINTFMRGEQWILNELEKLNFKKVIELGAGEGWLVNQIKSRFPNAEVLGIDLVARPDTVNSNVEWHCGDVMEYQGYDGDTVVVANLFIHHLSSEQLQILGEKLSGLKSILFAEPLRAKIPKVMGRVFFPIINDVTRHDMIVSIEAGFKKGELPTLFPKMDWTESCGLFGGLRVKGVRE